MTETCCDSLQEVMKRWSYPLYYPVSFTKDRDMKSLGLVMHVFDLTASGKIATKNKGVLLLNYCPICGANLRDDPPTAEGEQ